MEYLVKNIEGLDHAGETGKETGRNKDRIYLEFSSGQKSVYSFDEVEFRGGGLTPEEGSVMDDLVSAWNKFIKLEKQHPCDINEFGDSIHKLQGILAMRPLRRQYPDYWKSYKE